VEKNVAKVRKKSALFLHYRICTVGHTLKTLQLEYDLRRITRCRLRFIDKSILLTKCKIDALLFAFQIVFSVKNTFKLQCVDTSRSRIFHLYVHVTITGEGLQNLGQCSALRAFEQGGIFIVPQLL
jgi:hypothetical protein